MALLYLFKGQTMTHKDWIKLLLDGGKGTSDWCVKNEYIYYDETDCTFKYHDEQTVDIRIHIKDLEEYKEYNYPLYFRHCATAQTVKFVGLRKGAIVADCSAHSKDRYVTGWIPHTDTDIWTQVDNPKETVKVAKYASKIQGKWDDAHGYYRDDEDFKNNSLLGSFPYRRLDYTEMEVDDDGRYNNENNPK